VCGGGWLAPSAFGGAQKDINAFSRLNNQYHELKDELNTQKEDLVNLQDAQNEVMMQMDDTEPVKMSIGEVYCDQTQDDAMDMLNAKVEEAESDVTKKEQQMADVKVRVLPARPQTPGRLSPSSRASSGHRPPAAPACARGRGTGARGPRRGAVGDFVSAGDGAS